MEGDVSTRRSTLATHGGEGPYNFLQAVGSTLVYCCRIPFMANHRRLRLQWGHEHIALQADWHRVVFSDESHFNLWDHDGCIRVRRYADERCLPKCVIERHSDLTLGVMVWGAISYRGRSNLLQIEDNFNINRYVRKVLHPDVVPFLQGILEAIFQQDNARPHVAKTVRDFCSAQHMQLLPWPVNSPDMSPIEPVWDLIGRCLARDPRPKASKDELLQRIQAIWNYLLQADTQNLLTPCHVVGQRLLATPNTDFEHLLVKVSYHGWDVTGSSPIAVKTRLVGQRCTLNLPGAQTPSHWCGS
ncbi:transposable element Tc3 transposase [Trichonephila clavipes]|nr:transposable element Tc3 transposase [Trichonephila clavipes]